jgi:hypothetical protein
MMRAMVILYIGPNQRPDFKKDYLLSPMVTPETLLAEFPPTYLVTGERDPLVDHTLLFAGRLRKAREMYGSPGEREAVVEVHLIPGISHGFMQMAQLYPPAKSYFEKTATWISKTLKLDEVETSTTHGIKWGIFKATAISGDIFKTAYITSTKVVNPLNEDDQVDPTTPPVTDLGVRAPPLEEVKSQLRENKGVLYGAKQAQESRKVTISLSQDEDLIARRMKVLAEGLKDA